MLRASVRKFLNSFSADKLAAAVAAAPTGVPPSAVYSHLAAQGLLERNDAQIDAMINLDRLYHDMRSGVSSLAPRTEPQSASKSAPQSGGVFGSLFGGAPPAPVTPAVPAATGRVSHKGVYLYGGVGCGKTLMMDIFNHCRPRSVTSRRCHFNEFMLDVHKRVHEARATQRVQGDAVPAIAGDLAVDQLLCFDEMQVTSIQDAMVVRRLFDALFERGVTLVTTSNRPPQELYENGLNREQFTPFIDAIMRQCDVKPIAATMDFRTSSEQAVGVIITGNKEGGKRLLEDAFRAAAVEGSKWHGVHLAAAAAVANSTGTWKRPTGAHWPKPRGAVPGEEVGKLFTLPNSTATVQTMRTAGRVALIDFEALCGGPTGPREFHAVSQYYHTILIDNVPVLNDARRDAARRFIMLVDELYNAHCRVVLATSAPSLQGIFNLKPDSDLASTSTDQRYMLDSIGASANLKESPFTSKEELFASARTISRLSEMGTESYWAAPHVNCCDS